MRLNKWFTITLCDYCRIVKAAEGAAALGRTARGGPHELEEIERRVKSRLRAALRRDIGRRRDGGWCSRPPLRDADPTVRAPQARPRRGRRSGRASGRSDPPAPCRGRVRRGNAATRSAKLAGASGVTAATFADARDGWTAAVVIVSLAGATAATLAAAGDVIEIVFTRFGISTELLAVCTSPQPAVCLSRNRTAFVAATAMLGLRRFAWLHDVGRLHGGDLRRAADHVVLRDEAA